MASTLKKLLAEMAAIFLVAVAVGIAWNHSLLYRAWTGNASDAESARPEGNIPLPLGLVQVKELYDRKGALFVDARDAAAFAAGHIEGAVSLPVGEFSVWLPRFNAQVKTSAMLVAYCNGYDCQDSRELAAKLLQAGYRTVFVFEGGFPEWRDAGYPTAGGKK
jgi:rhodanese-related sulfurtransferase